MYSITIILPSLSSILSGLLGINQYYLNLGVKYGLDGNFCNIFELDYISTLNTYFEFVPLIISCLLPIYIIGWSMFMNSVENAQEGILQGINEHIDNPDRSCKDLQYVIIQPYTGYLKPNGQTVVNAELKYFVYCDNNRDGKTILDMRGWGPHLNYAYLTVDNVCTFGIVSNITQSVSVPSVGVIGVNFSINKSYLKNNPISKITTLGSPIQYRDSRSHIIALVKRTRSSLPIKDLID